MTPSIERLRARVGVGSAVDVDSEVVSVVREASHERFLLRYGGDEGETIPAYLFVPRHSKPVGGVVVFHQHASQFHLGKSEVAGDAGAPEQAFGPALAKRGVVVLAPDAIGFEDRRATVSGMEEHEDDWLQHYNSMAYRMLDGDLLLRKCLDDAQRAVSVLLRQPSVQTRRIGTLGHSFGGILALYHAAFDSRVAFTAVSGALCSVSKRRSEGTGISMVEVIPGGAKLYEHHDLVASIAPRELLVVSAGGDRYSRDAAEIVARSGVTSGIEHLAYEGGHDLDPERHGAIVKWVAARAVGPVSA